MACLHAGLPPQTSTHPCSNPLTLALWRAHGLPCNRSGGWQQQGVACQAHLASQAGSAPAQAQQCHHPKDSCAFSGGGYTDSNSRWAALWACLTCMHASAPCVPCGHHFISCSCLAVSLYDCDQNHSSAAQLPCMCIHTNFNL